MRKVPTTLVPMLVAIPALVLAVACADSTGPQPATREAVQAPRFDKKATSPTKYEFFHVTLSDEFTDATIYATSKLTGSGTGTTVCEYQTATGEYLGQFEAPVFVGATQTQTADEAVKQYCIDNFANR